MAQRVNCEAFRVRASGPAGANVIAGMKAHKVPGRQGLYMDPQPDNGRPPLWPLSKDLRFVLRGAETDSNHEVHQFSIAGVMRQRFNELSQENPLKLAKPVEETLGRAALVSIIDRRPQAAAVGHADIIELEEGAEEIQKIQTASAPAANSGFAGVSVVYMPEGSSLSFKSESTYVLEYDPDTGLAVAKKKPIARSSI